MGTAPGTRRMEKGLARVRGGDSRKKDGPVQRRRNIRKCEVVQSLYFQPHMVQEKKKNLT